MHLNAFLPTADDVLALEPDELGHVILKVLNSWPPHEALQLGTFINTILNHPQTPSAGPYPTNRRGELQEALSTAWAWLEGQALLIRDPRYGEGVVKLSSRARKLAQEQPVKSTGDTMTDVHGFSQEGRKVRFEQWEKLGLDRVKAGLQSDPYARIGNQQIQDLAWEWVRMKEAGQPKISDGPAQVVTAPAQKPPELLTLRPGIWGVSVDLKEVGRRVSSRWQKWRGKHR